MYGPRSTGTWVWATRQGQVYSGVKEEAPGTDFKVCATNPEYFWKYLHTISKSFFHVSLFLFSFHIFSFNFVDVLYFRVLKYLFWKEQNKNIANRKQEDRTFTNGSRGGQEIRDKGRGRQEGTCKEFRCVMFRDQLPLRKVIMVYCKHALIKIKTISFEGF